MINQSAPKLDLREQHFRISSHHDGLSLFLRYLPPSGEPAARKVVVYVHGATFPSALSIAHRFDGRSWRDELCAAGFHTWGFDFHGYGRFSDNFPELAAPADAHPPLGRAEDASQQLERAVRFIAGRHQVRRISLIAHSWGTMAAGRFAGRCPDLVERLVMFGPITRRARSAMALPLTAWRLISLKAQWDRFVEDVPADAAPVLSKRHFAEWGELYLDGDPDSRGRVPPSVKTPNGPFQDIAEAWAGTLAYDPALIRAPVAIIRGEWDGMCDDGDAAWLYRSLTASPLRRDVKISRGTHLMHLETSRYALYRETEAFLTGRDTVPASESDALPQSAAASREAI